GGANAEFPRTRPAACARGAVHAVLTIMRADLGRLYGLRHRKNTRKPPPPFPKISPDARGSGFDFKWRAFMKFSLSKADLFFWPIAAVGGVGVLAVIAAVFSLAHEFDLASRAREQTLVSNGVEGRIAEVAHMVVPQAMWDDAVTNL